MIAPWAVYAVVLASLVALAAAAADRLAAIWQTPRRLTWLAALVAALGLPVILATGIGSKDLPRHTLSVVESIPEHNVSVASTTDASSSTFAVGGAVRHTRSTELQWAMAAIEPHLIALWSVSSLILLVIVCGAAIRLATAMRRWRATEVDGVHVLIAPQTGPAIVGVLRPRIVLPEW